MTETTWHYNIVKDGENYSLREVFVDHNPNPKGKDGISWTSAGVDFNGDSRAEIIEALEMALSDAKKHKTLDIGKEDASN